MLNPHAILTLSKQRGKHWQCKHSSKRHWQRFASYSLARLSLSHSSKQGERIMTLEQIDNSIFWQEHVRDNSRDPAQRARCNAAIEKLMAQRMDIKRAQDERDQARGTREHAAWYDTSAELR
jgi:hypothetical protein